MNDQLSHLIEALREELKQYGEMLALLDQQQEQVMRRQAHDLLRSAADVNAQTSVIAAARNEREQRQRDFARSLGLAENAGFTAIVPRLPADYRPLVEALVAENNELLVRVQQRVRQNHLLLSHAVELMQQLVNTLFPGAKPKIYDDSGRAPAAAFPQNPIYQAVG